MSGQIPITELHAKTNRALRMSKNFDAVRLKEELGAALAELWHEHFNQMDYDGSWTAIALRSKSGNAQDIFAHGSQGEYRDTNLMHSCTYVRKIMEELPFEKEAVRLMRLGPGSVIKEHRDRGLAYRFGCFRLHIPITTGTDVDFRVGGITVPMENGECWYADFDMLHAVNNRGEHDRIHLVIDGLRNTWTDSWFAECGYDFAAEKKALEPDDATTRRTIEELERLNPELFGKLIAELKQKLNEG